MAGRHKFRDLVAQRNIDPVHRAQIEDEKRAIYDALTIGELRELRERRGATQTSVAGALGTSQANVSKLEARIDDERDVYLSTLRAYVEALGGRLQLLAVFPDETIELTQSSVHADVAARP